MIELGLAAAGAALLARAIAPGSWKWYRPLSCAVCMAFWSVLIPGAVWAWSTPAGEVATRLPDGLGAVAVAAVIYRLVFPPPVLLPGERN